MKPNKAILGIFTAIPFVGSIVISVWIFSIAINIIAEQSLGNELSEDEILRLVISDFISIAVIAMAIGLISLVLTIYYIVLAVKNDKIEPNMKILWVILLFIFSGITKIIYYFAVIIPDNYNEPLTKDKLNFE